MTPEKLSQIWQTKIPNNALWKENAPADLVRVDLEGNAFVQGPEEKGYGPSIIAIPGLDENTLPEKIPSTREHQQKYNIVGIYTLRPSV